MAGACATFCTIMSALGVFLMSYFGLLCQQNSPMISVPEKQKPDAGMGCFMAAGLYFLTFLYSYIKMKGAQKASASAREVQLRPARPEAGRRLLDGL
mmetsp:Transcript_51994/g.148196  ORF Transcript_51994/g.148196 Transcript_51994/m.148196 type:complete len:97 (+) Transcript_51994:65-355(+)